jgi:hypothetical protein
MDTNRALIILLVIIFVLVGAWYWHPWRTEAPKVTATPPTTTAPATPAPAPEAPTPATPATPKAP